MSAGDRNSNYKPMGINGREHGRGDVEIYADVREHGGGTHKAYIIDLSRTGFRIRSSTHIRSDRSIFMTLPGYASLEAKIVWHDSELYGCEFINRKLHEAIFENILRQYPALSRK